MGYPSSTMPAAATMPPSWRIWPLRSKTGTSSQEWSGRKPRRPEDRLHATLPEVHAKGRRSLDLGGGKRRGGATSPVDAAQRRPFVEAIEEAGELQIGKRTLIAERTGELRPAVDNPCQPADKPDPDLGQGVQVEDVALEPKPTSWSEATGAPRTMSSTWS